MTEIREIDASVQYFYTGDEDWSDINIPIPDGLWVYDTVKKCIYQGDGTTLIRDLSPSWNIKGAEDVAEFLNKFPDMSGHATKMVVINDDGTGFKYIHVDLSLYKTTDQITAALTTLEEKVHNHDDLFYTTAEVDHRIENRLSPVTRDEVGLISVLILEELAGESSEYGKFTGGYCSTLINLSNIDTAKSNYTSSNSSEGWIELAKDEYFTTVKIDSAKVPKASEIILRVDVSNSASDVNNLKVEVSKDNGSTYKNTSKYINSIMIQNYRFVMCKASFDNSDNKELVLKVTNEGDTPVKICGYNFKYKEL